jgi:uncharacterized HhH-GPD family protein
VPRLTLTGDPSADALLSDNAFTLDQQISMELAFRGPARLAERLDGALTPAAVTATDLDELETMFREKPALHRYPGSMSKRVHALARHIVEEYDGDAGAVWAGATDGTDLKRRLRSLPGFGEQKARIFVALLGKQCGVEPAGWREAAGDYGLDGHRSIADVTDAATLDAVREWKQARKAAAEAAS